MCDLRAYTDANDTRIHYDRDNAGLEVGAILKHSDGRWIAAEIKFRGRRPDDAATTLLRLRHKVNLDTRKASQPNSWSSPSADTPMSARTG